MFAIFGCDGSFSRLARKRIHVFSTWALCRRQERPWAGCHEKPWGEMAPHILCTPKLLLRERRSTEHIPPSHACLTASHACLTATLNCYYFGSSFLWSALSAKPLDTWTMLVRRARVTTGTEVGLASQPASTLSGLTWAISSVNSIAATISTIP